MTSLLSLLLLALLSNESLSFAFVRRNGGSRLTVLKSVAEAEETAAKSESLVFNADFSYTSEPFEAKSDEIIDFFKRKETRTLLLSAGGKRTIKDEALTFKLLEMWEEQCAVFYGATSWPVKGDEAISSVSKIKFPGLSMVNTICTGAKLKLDEEGFPMYEFALIADKREVSGPAPIVWIFNQLTGAKKRNKDEWHMADTRARSLVYIVKNDSNKYSFRFDLEMEVEVKFSKMLLKILPASKEKMEMQGSKSILKAVKGDIIDSIDSLREGYLS